MQDRRRRSQLGEKQAPEMCVEDELVLAATCLLVRDIKQGNSKRAKQQAYFPQFSGWGKENGAFSCSQREKESVVNYIINQREHHLSRTFEDEYQSIIEAYALEWNHYTLT